MVKSDQSRPIVGPKGWLALALVLPALVILPLSWFDVIGPEGLGYLVPVCVLASLPLAVAHWRGIDEPSREAHKFAFFWGMGFGVAIAALIAFELVIFSEARDLIQGWVDGYIRSTEGESGDQPGAVGFYLGVLACVTLATAGYLVVWLGWWAYQRFGTKSD